MNAEQPTSNVEPRTNEAVVRLRAGQREFMRGLERYRMAAFVARRQYGKTTTFSAIALKKMMKRRDHTVVFGSAKLTLAREIVRKEAAIMQKAIAALVQGEAAARLRLSDGKHQWSVERGGAGARPNSTEMLSEDDFAELFEAQRMEFRFYHDNVSYSRTKVVALNPDTVGETGDLMCDELRSIRNWREVWEAVEPIISSDPTFNLTLSTTPPTDDLHYAFEQLMPPLGVNLPVNPLGNWYRTEYGINVLAVSAFDAEADGVPLYDLETGEAISAAESRRRSKDKESWDRNYGIKFLFGGTAACGLVVLNHAQTRGEHDCRFVMLEEEGDLEGALEFLRANLGDGRVGLGWDLATTEKESSNPSSLAVVERRGVEAVARLVLGWKTADPELAKAYVRTVLEAISERPAGRARRLCVDATNERYFATEVQKEFRGLVPVQLVVGSETIEQPGSEPITMKAYLGNQLVAELEDAHLVLPPEQYIRDDFRRVKKNKGSFDCEMGPNGEHGDTFDAVKLGIEACIGKRRGPAMVYLGASVGGPSRV